MFGKIDFLMVIKLLFKLLVMTLVILVVGVFLWRFSISRIPDELMELTPNATLSEAYAQNPDLTLFTQEQNTTTRGENSYGYFTVCDAVFIPEAGQVQILIRYNDSTLRATEEEMHFGISTAQMGKYHLAGLFAPLVEAIAAVAVAVGFLKGIENGGVRAVIVVVVPANHTIS